MFCTLFKTKYGGFAFKFFTEILKKNLFDYRKIINFILKQRTLTNGMGQIHSSTTALSNM